jgi:methylmalonyl-CoA mutase cobalamin-binding domain/chain
MGELKSAMIDLNKAGVLSAVQADISAGRDPLEIVDEARDGMEEVGQKFEQGKYYLMELMRAAQIFEAAAEILNPVIKERYGDVESKGTILLGTVKGDIHDLGKNIVGNLLACRGFEVIDLGVDVQADEFVKMIKEHKPRVVGLSALLTACVQEMNNTVKAMEDAGIREQVKVIVGGGIVGEIRDNEIGADHATTDANDGIRVIDAWFGSEAER